MVLLCLFECAFCVFGFGCLELDEKCAFRIGDLTAFRLALSLGWTIT